MKKLLFLAFAIVALASACAQKTCPTYATNDALNITEEVVIETVNI
jgi:hypothetical protein